MFQNLWLVRSMQVIKYALIHFLHQRLESRAQELDDFVKGWLYSLSKSGQQDRQKSRQVVAAILFSVTFMGNLVPMEGSTIDYVMKMSTIENCQLHSRYSRLAGPRRKSDRCQTALSHLVAGLILIDCLSPVSAPDDSQPQCLVGDLLIVHKMMKWMMQVLMNFKDSSN